MSSEAEVIDHNFLLSLVNNLRDDLTSLQKAFTFAEDTSTKFLAERTNGEVVHHATVDFAALVAQKFGTDEKAYRALLERSLERRPKRGNTLFGFDSPERDDPEAEASQLVDRIDVALNYLKGRLAIELPTELRREHSDSISIRNGGWHVNRCIDRTLAFAEAAADVFDPVGRVLRERVRE